MQLKSLYILIPALLLFFFVFNIKQCSDYKEQLSISEHNMKALQDSVRFYRTQSNNLYAKYIEINKIPKEEKKEIIKYLKSEPKIITKVQTITKIDTLWTEKDSIVPFKYSFNDKYINLNVDTLGFKLNVNTPITVGYTKDNQFYLSTPNPYVSITDIKGHIEPIKQNKLGFSVTLGPTILYNPFNQSFNLGIGLTTGISYKL